MGVCFVVTYVVIRIFSVVIGVVYTHLGISIHILAPCCTTISTSIYTGSTYLACLIHPLNTNFTIH